jgi:predicted nucleotidyltransferase
MVQFDTKKLAEICRRNDVARVRMFGSAARGEDTPASDIDLIVDFHTPKGFFELVRLEDELKAFFGRKVDVVTEPGLSASVRRSILPVATVIFDDAA